jgi:hypothetical protein
LGKAKTKKPKKKEFELKAIQAFNAQATGKTVAASKDGNCDKACDQIEN